MVKSFGRLEQRLEGQLSRICPMPESERSALASEANQLRSDLAYLEDCQKQAWALWDETYEIGQRGLAHHKPDFLGLIEEHEQFANDSQVRCDPIEEVITKAATKYTMFLV